MMIVKKTIFVDAQTDDDPDEQEVEFPGKYEVCHRCQGRGAHVNPNIDGHGISQEEWDREWGEEERENYFNGVYDVICSVCKGMRVTIEIDNSQLTDEQKVLLATFEEQEEDRMQMEREDAYTRRMESGGYGYY